MKRAVFILAGLALPLAAAAETLQIGSSPSVGNLRSLPGLVNNIYNLAYLIGGLLAFGAVVYGAVRYTFSGGNPAAQSDARDQLTQAAFGLLLLLGSYVVLNTISPNLTSFTFPSLKKVAPGEEYTPWEEAGGYACDKSVDGTQTRFCSSKPDCSDTPQCQGQACKPVYACKAGPISQGMFKCDKPVNGVLTRFCGSKTDCSDNSQCGGQICGYISTCIAGPVQQDDSWYGCTSKSTGELICSEQSRLSNCADLIGVGRDLCRPNSCQKTSACKMPQ